MAYQHNFDEVTNRVETDSFKWDEEGAGGKYIAMGVADADFKVAPEILATVREKIDEGIYGYSRFPRERFTEAVANWYQKRYDLTVAQESVVFAPGLMSGALRTILEAYTRVGDKILIQTPVYNTFTNIIEGCGRVVAHNPMQFEDGRYTIDFEDLDQKTANPEVRILIVCNPANPTGRVWTKDELLKMYEICTKNDTLIVSDEIHGDIVYTPYQHVPFFSLSEEIADHVIVMGAPSKTFNLAGFSTSYVVIPNKALRDQYMVVFHNNHAGGNRLGMEALITAYDKCESYVDQQNAYLMKNIACVKDFLEEELPEVKLVEPEGTYLLWLDFRAWQLSSEELVTLFKRAGVCVNSGARYGKEGDGFIRMNIATQKATLQKALGYIKDASKMRVG